MKKKLRQKSEQGLPEQQSADYVVGQVSGSLFQDSAGSGSLSALFSAAPPPAPLVFLPAPKPVQKSTEVKEQKQTPKVKGPSQKPKKPSKEKTVADQKLENRESALQNADEDERGQKTPKKTKRKAADVGEGGGGEDEEERQMKRRKTKASVEEEAIKRKRTVFVGNLPVSCTKKTLRILFKDKGAIESIRFRSVVREDPSMSRKLAAIQRKVHPKKQSVNAYVVFKDEEGVAKALERNGMEIERDFHIRVDRVSENSSHDHKRSIFVGNLSFEINEVALRRHFEECGEVEAVRLVRDRNSGMGKGFGYVLFETADSVQLALKLDGSSLEGRSVRVKRSVKKEKVKTKTGLSKGPMGKTGKGPKKAPTGPEGRGRETKGTGREKGPSKGGFQGRPGLAAQRKFTGNQGKSTKSPGSFKGEMVDPSKKNKKKKGLKKKPRKTFHI